eukprot:7105614-Prymnesium_polylepis.1
MVPSMTFLPNMRATRLPMYACPSLSQSSSGSGSSGSESSIGSVDAAAASASATAASNFLRTLADLNLIVLESVDDSSSAHVRTCFGPSSAFSPMSLKKRSRSIVAGSTVASDAFSTRRTWAGHHGKP